MFNKSLLLGAILATTSITIALPRSAWADDTARITKLEERLGDLEARMAKSEAAMHKSMGMTMPKKSGSPMGMSGMKSQAPPAASEMGAEMPPADAPAAGGMGHM